MNKTTKLDIILRDIGFYNSITEQQLLEHSKKSTLM